MIITIVFIASIVIGITALAAYMIFLKKDMERCNKLINKYEDEKRHLEEELRQLESNQSQCGNKGK